MFSIRIRIKGYLENITENTKETIDVIGIKNKSNIHYIDNNVNYKLIVNNTQMTMIRETNDFTHKFIFELNKQNESEYYIKEYTTSVNINIITTKLLITEDKIEIVYKILDSEEEYRYLIEMRKEL